MECLNRIADEILRFSNLLPGYGKVEFFIPDITEYSI